MGKVASGSYHVKLLRETGAGAQVCGLWRATEPPEKPEKPVWYVRADPAAETALYEQIVRPVEEGVATGRLLEGERLPSVRQPEELEIAPGTVARAYSLLEERGVVVTEGAKGTRVAPRSARSEPRDERATALQGLFRPALVAAFHLGAKAAEVRGALERAMRDIFDGSAG